MLNAGYQRQLNYIHDDGSYSAFGKSDSEGSLWLTAFVVKSFAGAKRYVDIDHAQLQRSAQWLLTRQLENGCFPMIGRVLHSGLKVIARHPTNFDDILHEIDLNVDLHRAVYRSSTTI